MFTDVGARCGRETTGREKRASQQSRLMDRASFELTDEDVEALRSKLGLSGSLNSSSSLRPPQQHQSVLASVPVHERRSLPLALEDHLAFEQWRATHPCILTHFDEFTASLKGKRLAVFLDYDGTLTPIVANPDDAILSPQMRDVVRKIAQHFPTAIISGRGREKVEGFVQLRELYYAGSHGMDIAGPTDINGGSADSTFQPAVHFKPIIDEVYLELCERLKPIPGASVEHNTFCVSAHFRNCPGETWQQVVDTVEAVIAKRTDLRITRGRKVVEIRPKVNWHKGTALNHLLKVLGLKSQPDVVAIYIGDDHTDEDAFKALREGHQGFGILVSTKIKDTAACYTVRDPTEVMLFLQRLVLWGDTADNGWHDKGCCSGWSPTASRSTQQQAAASTSAAAVASAARVMSPVGSGQSVAGSPGTHCATHVQQPQQNGTAPSAEGHALGHELVPSA
mmetsp:Transcript_29655/g.65637  ORF Transcript_29655/g.65637 Transcript_29655/m.65637 type:complete len:452 (-) Transcript_29655:763-2118(-)|eukprot:CAMPEP_0202901296 /NCGR_PEP_ID=MMETSP1392-20130828/14174_1 /ASSEMBLY_ACC=CAM_ASM_000868 /TAXON_ID=225041 /ORGANISM="Chlamydomonas chlamydogama, Strain SAG 11-48b" /LENGTH=451 /DNA_ID=CAMNT_0049587841 /DNA_START=260 /DNA_END=1615 /DNA_ORIENTATION=+